MHWTTIVKCAGENKIFLAAKNIDTFADQFFLTQLGETSHLETNANCKKVKHFLRMLKAKAAYALLILILWKFRMNKFISF